MEPARDDLVGFFRSNTIRTRLLTTLLIAIGSVPFLSSKGKENGRGEEIDALKQKVEQLEAAQSLRDMNKEPFKRRSRGNPSPRQPGTSSQRMEAKLKLF